MTGKRTLRRRVFAVLAALAAAAATVPALATSPTFPDVGPEHPGHAAVERAAAEGWFIGYADGTFRPDEPFSERHLGLVVGRVFEDLEGLTRAEAAAFVVAGTEAVRSTRSGERLPEAARVQQICEDYFSPGRLYGPTSSFGAPITGRGWDVWWKIANRGSSWPRYVRWELSASTLGAIDDHEVACTVTEASVDWRVTATKTATQATALATATTVCRQRRAGTSGAVTYRWRFHPDRSTMWLTGSNAEPAVQAVQEKDPIPAALRPTHDPTGCLGQP